MKQRLITKITPYLFEEYLIIPLHKDWINVYKTIPTFEVRIDKEGRLILLGPSLKRSGDMSE
ncbi:MAG: hypothetical protein COA77_01365 [Thaumarchaeota archaeon]|nr:MAG: hypothetical protein COA77_01365 [Nitrososphaerota archaeon]